MGEEPKVRKIVVVRNKEDLAILQAALEHSGGRIVKELPLVGAFVCEFPHADSVALSMRGNEDKFEVEEDITLKLCAAPFFSLPLPWLWEKLMGGKKPADDPAAPVAMPRITDWGLKRIGAPEGWGKLRERRVRVGIIDTGINKYHSDLRDNFREGICTIDGRSSYLDDNGHGTHVAGTIAANNRNGMIGVHPYTDIYVVKAFDKAGNANLSDIIEGLDWLVQRQAAVINMSFSTTETSSNLYKAVAAVHQAGIVMVAAAGNDGGSVNYPARYSEVIAVSATDNQDRLASFSSRGPEINFCAPGVDIKSTWLSGYAVKSGTSFAAPHVTGAVCDILNYYGPLPTGQIIDMMRRKAVALKDLTLQQQGFGLLEIPRLLS